jgi:coproporphyrinogen III oxidase-like Fe-S oxidoreductase
MNAFLICGSLFVKHILNIIMGVGIGGIQCIQVRGTHNATERREYLNHIDLRNLVYISNAEVIWKQGLILLYLLMQCLR